MHGAMKVIGRNTWLIPATVLTALAVPVALLGTNARLAFSSLPVYTYAIDAFDASEKTGIGRAELVDAMRGLIEYFRSSEDLITTTVVTLEGVEEPLFNEREALHFRDVKALLNSVYLLQIAAVTVIVAFSMGAALAAARGQRVASIALMKGLRWGSYGTSAGIIVLGTLAALGAFNQLFIVFHQLSFENDLWQGVATDRMVQLFPEAFFLQGSLLVGLGAVFEASLIVAATTLAARTMRREPRDQTGQNALTP
jgi:integral membrane protein (TIGR01906 family)